jgi:molybdopterin-containing oxidoreductase family iron-sulfur binding subunit
LAKYAYVVDLSRCVGCRACVEACKVENNTGEGIFWMHVFRFEVGRYPNANLVFMPRPCMHCDNPPCVKVCPTGARYKREDGFVLTDFERCIGCRYCEVACPYGVNYFNWRNPAENQYYAWGEGEGDDLYGSGQVRERTGGAIPPYKNPDLQRRYGEEERLTAGGGHFVGVVEKCTWCVHRVERGLKPACVTTCPVSALHFGDISDPNSEVSRLLARRRWFRLLEERGTSPSVYYIGGAPPMGETSPGGGR